MTIQEFKANTLDFLKKIGIIGIISAFVLIVGYYVWRTWPVSEGTRSGILQKISKKGRIFKTYEGQMLLVGSSIANKESIFLFSVKDTKTYEEIQRLEGKNVILTYKELEDSFFWQGDTDYLVEKVEIAK
jgi:hypothetical protein